MERIFVIGDIHGALKALQQLISRINPTFADTLIFLGDYVDGWPESAQVIDYLADLQQRYKCIFIRGNHDNDCEKWLQGQQKKRTWLEKNGLSTIRSYQQVDTLTKTKHLHFLSGLLHYYIDEEKRLFLHGGFASNKGPASEWPKDNLTLDRSLWELARTMDKRVARNPDLYPKRLKLFKQIFIGHTPTLIQNSEVPLWACNVCNVDTGAGYFGRLSAIEIHSGKIVQSDPVPVLYPGVKGRS